MLAMLLGKAETSALDINAADKQGRTSLMVALRNSQEAVVRAVKTAQTARAAHTAQRRGTLALFRRRRRHRRRSGLACRPLSPRSVLPAAGQVKTLLSHKALLINAEARAAQSPSLTDGPFASE